MVAATVIAVIQCFVNTDGQEPATVPCSLAPVLPGACYSFGFPEGQL